MQRYKEDDLLLVAIDIKHHDNHHKTVLEGKAEGMQSPCLLACNFVIYFDFLRSPKLPGRALQSLLFGSSHAKLLMSYDL